MPSPVALSIWPGSLQPLLNQVFARTCKLSRDVVACSHGSAGQVVSRENAPPKR
ncbi:hypothetical protein K505DRAFT_322673 [Melanomma pulvis-pyrius CBS 109.77]|uniref:Uncharacterized protein n=1 Tax=Melanomma pulvis-pyrius CBS 109.77 TaxID=1314802 RepID=A0A6A6XLH2_9PLEO|nr:hypothetical protein K505DRAFT_322673 [Melanomma pulvis-pyrius CBS 109.77]